jgi:hypothetical protein
MAISTYSGIESRLYLIKTMQFIPAYPVLLPLTRFVVLDEGFDDDCGQRAEIFFGHGHCQLYSDVSSSAL